jgi:hypothetical protein
MANKSRALTLDLINNQLSKGDNSRGFSLRVKYTPFMFKRNYSIVAFDYSMTGFHKDMRFRYLEDAVNVVRDIEDMLEKSRYHERRELNPTMKYVRYVILLPFCTIIFGSHLLVEWLNKRRK